MRKPTASNGRQSKLGIKAGMGGGQTHSGRSREKETRGNRSRRAALLSSDSQSSQVSGRGRLTWLRYGTGSTCCFGDHVPRRGGGGGAVVAGERLLGQSEGAWPTARSRGKQAWCLSPRTFLQQKNYLKNYLWEVAAVQAEVGASSLSPAAVGTSSPHPVPLLAGEVPPLTTVLRGLQRGHPLLPKASRRQNWKLP